MSVDTISASTSITESYVATATVYTSYYARLMRNVDERPDLTHVAVSRYWPRWMKKPEGVLWLPNLGPSKQLLFTAKKLSMDFEEYGHRYLHEILDTRDGREALNRLLALLEDGEDVVLYCYEKDVRCCHRFWLSALLCHAYGFGQGGEL